MQVMNEEKILQVLTCIQQRQVETGRSPSYREIMKLCNLSSIGQVQRCIKVLKERGELETESRYNGQIALNNRFSGESASIPLLGEIPCGEPIFAVENFEGVYRLPIEFVGGGEHFMLRAKGSSMTGAGIKDGDLLIIRVQSAAEYGQIIAACIDDDATIKTYRPKGNKIILHPENPCFKDIETTPENCRILGVLVGSFHRYH